VCTYSALLGTKPVEGLVLNQSTWAKSESNLLLMSSVLGTAEHCMVTAGSLLKDKGDEFDEPRWTKALVFHNSF
jgi:hypothetical protein